MICIQSSSVLFIVIENCNGNDKPSYACKLIDGELFDDGVLYVVKESSGKSTKLNLYSFTQRPGLVYCSETKNKLSQQPD